jgi:Cof subfamily protein (haloacid dehalogenase superfamily)
MTTKNTLYVSDLDGTLLGRDSLLSDESVDILNHLIEERGVNFSIATARTPATVVNIMERVRTRLPYVVMNGAAMWCNASKQFLNTIPIPKDDLVRVCDIFESYGISPMVYRANGNRLEVRSCGTLSPQEEEFVNIRRCLDYKRFYLDDVNYKTDNCDALLVFAMNDYARLSPIHAEILATTQCSSVFYHDIYDARDGLMESYARGVSKAEAVRRLMAETDVERLVVFGDNRNDIPMMQIADLAVAPENAVDEVKAIAHVIIEPNYTHSVARFIANEIG